MNWNQVLGLLSIGGMVLGWVVSDTITQIAMTAFFQPLYIVQMAAFAQLLWLPFFKQIKWVGFNLLKHTLPLAALWSAATYFNLSSLHNTTLSSNEVLTTLMAPWALVLSVILFRAERHCLTVKVLAILFSFAGTFIITSTDEDSGQSRFLGDLYIIISAVCLGSYDVYFRYYIPQDTDVRAILIPMGLVVLIASFPLQYLLDITSAEPLARPSGKDLGVLFAAVISGNFVADFCIAKACLLLTPFVVTIGVSLNVPISMGIDAIIHSLNFEWQFMIGASCSLLGFVLAAMTELESMKQKLDDKNLIRCLKPKKDLKLLDFESINDSTMIEQLAG
jgi:drug/metabolite transporter (DMT)-like permease